MPGSYKNGGWEVAVIKSLRAADVGCKRIMSQDGIKSLSKQM